MKDYYETLGVSRYASAQEIKIAFRRLAIAYHPDRNPSKEAEVFIKEIIAAYEVLGDAGLRGQYDSLIFNDALVDNPPANRPHRDPRYQRRPPNPNYKSPKQKTLEMMTMYIAYALFASWCAVGFSLLLVLDFCLPLQKQTEVIRAFELTRGSSAKLVTMQGNEFSISTKGSGKFRAGHSVTVSYSSLLNVPVLMSVDQNPEARRVRGTIYGNFIFMPVIFLMTALTGVIYRKGTMFRFNLGIVNAILFVLNFIILFVHHLHLS
jgi:curved DNA-binding protein CbpA